MYASKSHNSLYHRTQSGRIAILTIGLFVSALVSIGVLVLCLAAMVANCNDYTHASAGHHVAVVASSEWRGLDQIAFTGMNLQGTSMAPDFPVETELNLENTEEIFGGRMIARIQGRVENRQERRSARQGGGSEMCESSSDPLEDLLYAMAHQSQQNFPGQQVAPAFPSNDNSNAAPPASGSWNKPAEVNPSSKQAASYPNGRQTECPCGPNCNCFNLGYAKAIDDLRKTRAGYSQVSSGNSSTNCTSVNGVPCMMVNGVCVPQQNQYRPSAYNANYGQPVSSQTYSTSVRRSGGSCRGGRCG